jgi:hypothetical protein
MLLIVEDHSWSFFVASNGLHHQIVDAPVVETLSRTPSNNHDGNKQVHLYWPDGV